MACEKKKTLTYIALFLINTGNHSHSININLVAELIEYLSPCFKILSNQKLKFMEYLLYARQNKHLFTKPSVTCVTL